MTPVDNSDYLDPDGYAGDIRPMTLHDRITFAIRDRFPNDATIWSAADDLAEAVLAELDLHREPGRLRVSRWVTTWIPDYAEPR